MSDLIFAIDLLKDELNELCEMQYSPKYSSDEITFKKRRQSIWLAIEKLAKANEAAEQQEKALHINIVTQQSEQLKAYAEFLQTRPDFQERSNKDLAVAILRYEKEQQDKDSIIGSV